MQELLSRSIKEAVQCIGCEPRESRGYLAMAYILVCSKTQADHESALLYLQEALLYITSHSDPDEAARLKEQLLRHHTHPVSHVSHAREHFEEPAGSTNT
jgi:hypothetical protein